jgi:D-serine deaminase-like pyridoxal phosphate-dependent protein
MVLETDGNHVFKPGDILIGIPYHICPTVALHETLHVLNGAMVDGEWKVAARKRKISI